MIRRCAAFCGCSHTRRYAALPKRPCALADGLGRRFSTAAVPATDSLPVAVICYSGGGVRDSGVGAASCRDSDRGGTPLLLVAQPEKISDNRYLSRVHGSAGNGTNGGRTGALTARTSAAIDRRSGLEVAMKLNIAVYQGAGVRGDAARALAVVRRVVARAAARGVRLVVFPELFLSGYNVGAAVRRLAEPAVGPSAEAIAAIAARSRSRGPVRLPGARRPPDLQLGAADRRGGAVDRELPQDPPLRRVGAPGVHARGHAGDARPWAG